MRLRTPDQPGERWTFEAQRLFDEHPPVLHSANKRVVLTIACPPGSTHGGQVVATRWKGMPLPGTFAPAEAIGHVVRHEEALRAEGASALTVEGGRPTPILVAGVERRCVVDTNPDRAKGRPTPPCG